MLDFILKWFGYTTISFDNLNELHNIIKRQNTVNLKSQFEITMLEALLDDLTPEAKERDNVVSFDKFKFNKYGE